MSLAICQVVSGSRNNPLSSVHPIAAAKKGQYQRRTNKKDAGVKKVDLRLHSYAPQHSDSAFTRSLRSLNPHDGALGHSSARHTESTEKFKRSHLHKASELETATYRIRIVDNNRLG